MVWPPRASNDLNAYGLFEQRRDYEMFVYPSNVPEPIDLWYERSLYGKVDLEGFSVFPSQGRMKQFSVPPDSEDTIFALNFVVDAFEDLRANLDRITTFGNVSPENDSRLVRLEAKMGYIDSGFDYNEYMKGIFDVFANSFMTEENRDERVFNIQTFVPIFIDFISIIGKNYPFTRSGFTRSGNYSILSTGLAVEFLAGEDAGEDESKYDLIINDPNFAVFAREAARYGFYIDKFVPWRLVFDINSLQTQRYFEPYGLTIDSLFREYFYKSSEVDFETLKIYFIQFYNQYVGTNPFVTKTRPSRCERNRTILENVTRQQISLDELNAIYDNKWWLRLYAYLRAVEADKLFDQQAFDEIVSKAQQIEKFISLEKAVEYIDSEFNDRDVRFVARDRQDLSEGNFKLTSSARPFFF